MRRPWVVRVWAVEIRELRKDFALAVRDCWLLRLWEEEERGRRRDVERRREVEEAEMEEGRAGVEADRPEEEEREEVVVLLPGEGKSGSKGGGIVGWLGIAMVLWLAQARGSSVWKVAVRKSREIWSKKKRDGSYLSITIV